MPRHPSAIAVAVAVAAVVSACAPDSTAPAGAASPAARRDGGGHDAGRTAYVTSSSDAGPGSLRAALERASVDPKITRVLFAPGLGPIRLASPVTYGGAQGLGVDGNGDVIVGPPCAGCDALIATGGADLTFEHLTVKGAGGTGISIRVPAGTEGTVAVTLRSVTIRGNGLHGLLVDDQAPAAGAPADPNDPVPFGFDSDAGVRLEVRSSTVQGNGFAGVNDFDGVRIDEGGPGGIEARIIDSRVLANGADGVELDERGPGSAALEARDSRFDRNGNNNAEDPDDAIDVDEAGEGSIVLRLARVTGNGNFDEGFDFTEADAGDIDLRATRVDAVGNADEGIKAEEGGEGGITARLTDVDVRGTTGADGIQLAEGGAGDLLATFTEVTVADNLEKGVNLEEGDAGAFRARFVRSTIARNGEEGIAAEQDGDGAGTLDLFFTRIFDNAGGRLDTDGVTVREVPPS